MHPIFNNLFNAYFGLQYTNDDPTFDGSEEYEPDYEACDACKDQVEELYPYNGEKMCRPCVEAEIQEITDKLIHS